MQIPLFQLSVTKNRNRNRCAFKSQGAPNFQKSKIAAIFGGGGGVRFEIAAFSKSQRFRDAKFSSLTFLKFLNMGA